MKEWRRERGRLKNDAHKTELEGQACQQNHANARWGHAYMSPGKGSPSALVVEAAINCLPPPMKVYEINVMVIRALKASPETLKGMKAQT